MSEQWYQSVAVVTGASRGIGARVAVALANAAVTVIGLSRNPAAIDQLNDDVTGQGKIHSQFCDLTDEKSILTAFAWIREKFQFIHILINNAGVLKANFLPEMSLKEIRECFDVNVIATTVCLRETLRHMKETQTKGHIIVISSILGHRIPDVPVPLFNVYPATKHAISALCKTTRQEIDFLKLNVKLTTISPGMVDTDILKCYSQSVADLPKLKADDVANAVIYALETPPYVQIEDILLQAMRRHD